MKGALLATVLCAFALAHAEINENGCPINPAIDILKPHPNCNKFYQCQNGELYALSCAANLVYNPETEQCDWPENVDCSNREEPAPGSNGSEETNNNGDNGGSGGNSNPGEAVQICAAEGSDGVLVAHENCNQFYKCSEGLPVALDCPLNLLYNPSNEQCDWPENVNCGDRNPDGGNGGNDGNGNENGGSDNGNGNGDNGGNGGNSNPGEAPQICAAEGSDGVLVAHENCNRFYKCSEGVPVALDCPLNLLYDPSKEQCDWPENVNCGDRNPDNGNGGNDGNGNGNGSGDSNSNENGNGNGDNGGNGGNSNPGEAPQICAAEGSDGVLVAHQNCNQFYKCSEGVPVALDCPLNLLYDPSKEQCDWPENVDCSSRNLDGGNGNNNDNENGGSNGNGNENGGTGNGDNSGNGGNSNPGEAPQICAAEGSDGVLVAHENCNQFYKCSEGVPVALDCPLNLLYDPSKEQCDWPENVSCGNGNLDAGNGDNNGNGDGSNSGDSSDEGNSNPSEAIEICAAEGSDGFLVAHENCGQFYKCSEGLPVALDCPAGLLYNPSNEQCDWPENVNCDGRNPNSGLKKLIKRVNNNPSEAPRICATAGSNGVLVAHENCNQFYKCYGGIPVALDCPLNLLYNPNTEQCDWPENVNCADRTPDQGNGDNDNNGDGSNSGDSSDEGNVNPSEAIEICTAEGSDGVLVAHENCGQFYKCSEGLPVALDCPAGLLYNPSNEQCDWPSNVNCGDRNRNIFTSLNKHMNARRALRV